jgi:hypothetical protein
VNYFLVFVNCAIWFWMGWYFRGIRAGREQGETLTTMFSILEAQTKHTDGGDS